MKQIHQILVFPKPARSLQGLMSSQECQHSQEESQENKSPNSHRELSLASVARIQFVWSCMKNDYWQWYGDKWSEIYVMSYRPPWDTRTDAKHFTEEQVLCPQHRWDTSSHLLQMQSAGRQVVLKKNGHWSMNRYICTSQRRHPWLITYECQGIQRNYLFLGFEYGCSVCSGSFWDFCQCRGI